MQREEFIVLATKVWEGVANEMEYALYLNYLNIFSEGANAWESISEAEQSKIREDVYFSVSRRITKKAIQHNRFTFYKNRKWRLGIAATLAFVTLSATILYFYHSTNQHIEGYAKDIVPGYFGATLTLSNGSTINLNKVSKGKIGKDGGIAIEKTADGKIDYSLSDSLVRGVNNTLSTGNGQTYMVNLPDGSRVWLNAASSITYNTGIQYQQERKVRLSGEAYLEVAKDPLHPFIVETINQTVQVLGTHFNICDYPGDLNAVTTLLEGSVKINDVTVIKPGQQAGSINKGAVMVKDVAAEEAIAWKNGRFIFSDEPLESIMKKVSRWYNVEIVYENVNTKELFYGSMSRYDHISKVLSKLEIAGGIHFKIEGRRILVSK